MTTPVQPVTEAPVQGVPSGTPEAAGVGAPAAPQQVASTPGTATVDAGQGQLTAAQVQAKYEADIRALKSSLQRQQSETEQQHRQREQRLATELEALKTKGMDENQRRQYELEKAQAEVAQYRDYIGQLQGQVQVTQQMQEWASYFTREMGVAPDRLDMSSPQALLDSGWGGVKELTRGGGNRNPAKPVLAAPEVVTAQAPTPTGNTWAALLARYPGKTQEDIYRMVELEILPASVIPAEAE
jgi:hypothetical protein